MVLWNSKLPNDVHPPGCCDVTCSFHLGFILAHHGDLRFFDNFVLSKMKRTT